MALGRVRSFCGHVFSYSASREARRWVVPHRCNSSDYRSDGPPQAPIGPAAEEMFNTEIFLDFPNRQYEGILNPQAWGRQMGRCWGRSFRNRTEALGAERGWILTHAIQPSVRTASGISQAACRSAC